VTLVQPTRILVVGRGGREHALAWKLADEPGVNEVYVHPGSDAMAALPRVRRVSDGDPVEIARRHSVELVVVGPEAPLADGLVDRLQAAGVAAFGPTAAAARIEASKAFCREVAEAAGVPMARGRAFEDTDPSAALAFALGLDRSGRVVVKADGLAAGKGVAVCDTVDEAAAAIAANHGTTVVEERLEGREASVIAICDGTRAVALPAARDHKRLRDGDEGPNTGGMGAYSPVPDLGDAEVDEIVERFHRPVLAELARRGTPFRGALYAGLMLTGDGPRLLEFNARFGDPETQVILPRLGGALAPWLRAAALGALPRDAPARLPVLPRASVGVVLAADGYPGDPRRGDAIDGLDEAGSRGSLVFHAGTRGRAGGGFETDGGRVLTVVGLGDDLDDARSAAERTADAITWPGVQRRRDIGRRLPVAEAVP
jgi:phosphoribosylamine--glycine ligase